MTRVPVAVLAAFVLALGVVISTSGPANANSGPYVSGDYGGQILAVGFPVGNDVSVSVNGLPLGTQTVVGESTDFNFGSQLHPGDYIVATDGATTKELTLDNVGVDFASPATNVVSGFAPDGRQVTVDPNAVGDPPQSMIVSNGQFSFTFSDIHPSQPGTVFTTDGEGDRTVTVWSAFPAQLFVNAQYHNLEGWNFEANVDIHVYDQLNLPHNQLRDDLEPIGPSGGFSHDFGNFDLLPGMWIEVTDGTTTKDVVVTDMEVWGANAANGTVYGHASPNATLWVKTINQGSDCKLFVQADGQGDWIADFENASSSSQPTDCTVPSPWVTPLITPGQQIGVQGDAFQEDGDGDWSAHELWNPSRINVSAMSDRVEPMGNSFKPGADVTITIDDPGTGTNPDVTAHATAGSGWPNQFSLCTGMGSQVNMYGCTAVGGPIDIQPGFTVTASDGVTTKSEVVTGLTVTGSSLDPGKVFGTAMPGSDVLVTIFDWPTAPQRTTTADPNGNWTADFSVAQGNQQPYQLSLNSSGSAFQLELTGEIDGDETNYWFSAAPWISIWPGANLFDGQMVSINGENWLPNENMTLVECARGMNGPNPNVCDNPNTAQQLTTGGDGRPSTQYQVHRVITVNGNPYNCATEPNGCGLAAIEWPGDIGQGSPDRMSGPDSNQIFFGPYLDITPNSNLFDGQWVTISGAGWPANKTMHVTECGRGLGGPSVPTCDGNTTRDFLTGPDGTVNGQYQVARVITITVNNVTGPYDCTQAQGCGLVSVVWLGQEGHPEEGISLSGPDSQPIFFGATFDVNPDIGLSEGQMVGISGSGWPSNKTMYVTECALGFPLGVDTCDASTQQQFMTSQDGSVFGQYRVSRSIFTAKAGIRDCAAAPNWCGLVAVVWHGDVGDINAGITISFPESNPLSFTTPADALAPTIKITAPADGAIYPEHKIVKAAYTCADTGGSGLASCIGDVASGSPIDTTNLGAHTFRVLARDRAGNLMVLTRHYTVVDATAPTIVLSMPTNGATFNKGASIVANYSCFDAGSGISTCLGTTPNGWSIDTSSIGKKTFTVTAIDNAGNVTKVTAAYYVQYGWNGLAYLAPPPALNPGGTAGQQLDVGFYLSGNQGLPVTTSVKSVRIDCAWQYPIGKTEAATGTVVFGGDRYHFLWTTKAAWVGTCRQLQITLRDGTLHTVNFQF